MNATLRTLRDRIAAAVKPVAGRAIDALAVVFLCLFIMAVIGLLVMVFAWLLGARWEVLGTWFMVGCVQGAGLIVLLYWRERRG